MGLRVSLGLHGRAHTCVCARACFVRVCTRPRVQSRAYVSVRAFVQLLSICNALRRCVWYRSHTTASAVPRSEHRSFGCCRCSLGSVLWCVAGIAVLSLLSFLGSLPSLTPQWAQVRPVCHAGVTEVPRRRRHGHGHGLPLRSVRRGPGPWRGAGASGHGGQVLQPDSGSGSEWPNSCAFPPQPPGERTAGRAGPGRPPAESPSASASGATPAGGLSMRGHPPGVGPGPWHASVLLVHAGLTPGRVGCAPSSPQWSWQSWWWWWSRCSVNGGHGAVLAPALAVTVALSGRASLVEFCASLRR